MDEEIGTESLSTFLHIQLINGRSRIQISDYLIPNTASQNVGGSNEREKRRKHIPGGGSGWEHKVTGN